MQSFWQGATVTFIITAVIMAIIAVASGLVIISHAGMVFAALGWYACERTLRYGWW